MDERYARHFVLKEIGVEGQEKLRSSKVLIVGAGGLGSAAALYLAAAGVGTLGIADPDRVELANLQRQIIHSFDRIGENKALSAKKSMEKLNGDIAIEAFPFALTEKNCLELIGQFDFVLDCTDGFGSKFLINDACVLSKKAFSHAGVVRFSGQLMTYVPGQGPCLRCLMGEVPPKGASPLCREVGVLGAVVGVLGCMQAIEAVKYLVGIGELLTGRVLRFDALTMKSNIVSFPHANPDCPVCGGKPFSLSAHADDYH